MTSGTAPTDGPLWQLRALAFGLGLLGCLAFAVMGLLIETTLEDALDRP